MAAASGEALISEDYADLLIEYNGDMTVFDAFPEAEVNIINSIFAAVSVPVSRITESIIVELGYVVLPACFGLISEASLESSGVLRIRNVPNFNLRGKGVLIGIVDTGVDYTNPIFQYADGSTRIVSIWDQTIEGGNLPAGMSFGSEYTREQINEALASGSPLDIVPSTDTIGHGTMVAGIAGGNEVPEQDFFGVAPDVEFVAVKLKQAKEYLRNFFFIPEGAICYQETDLLFGLRYMTDKLVSLGRPMVICVALGSNQGGHDGRESTSRYLSLASTRSSLAVAIAGGNEGNKRRHYFGTVDMTIGYDTVELNISENETGFSMEFWGQAPNLYSIDILTPSGEYVPRIVAGMNESRVITFIFEPTIIYIDYQIVEGQSGDQLILLRFQEPSPGIWRFNVYQKGDIAAGFHIWLPMDGFISENTYFIRSDPYTTLLSLANASIPITITAYNDADDSLYISAGRGYTRLGGIKPDVAAPGVNIVGPDLRHGFMAYTGTSAAVAHTAGIIAMLLEWGEVKGNLPGISTVEIKKLLIRGARRDVDIVYPNRDWGYGILDIYNVFNSLRTSLIV